MGVSGNTFSDETGNPSDYDYASSLNITNQTEDPNEGQVTIPLDWWSKCQQSNEWCKWFFRHILRTGKVEKLFPDIKKVDFELPANQRAEILKQCKDKEKGVCAKQLQEARNSQQVKWMMEQALRMREESKNTSDKVIIGVASLSVILIITSLVLYYVFFRTGSKRKRAKPLHYKSSVRSKIISGKGTIKSSVGKRSKYSVKSSASGRRHSKKSSKSGIKTATKSKKSNSTVVQAKSKKSIKNANFSAKAVRPTFARKVTLPTDWHDLLKVVPPKSVSGKNFQVKGGERKSKKSVQKGR